MAGIPALGGMPTLGGIASAVSAPVIAGGVALGGMGYEMLRSTNLGPWKGLPGIGEIAGHYLSGGNQNAATAQAASGAQSPQIDMQKYIDRFMGSVSNSWQNAGANPDRSFQLPRPGAMLGGVQSYFENARRQGTAQRGSWAQGAEGAIGGYGRDGLNAIQGEINEYRNTIAEMRKSTQPLAQSDTLDKILKQMEAVAKNTAPGNNAIDRLEKALNNFAAAVVGNAMSAAAREQAHQTLRP
jgi:hypothetical protein